MDAKEGDGSRDHTSDILPEGCIFAHQIDLGLRGAEMMIPDTIIGKLLYISNNETPQYPFDNTNCQE